MGLAKPASGRNIVFPLVEAIRYQAQSDSHSKKYYYSYEGWGKEDKPF